MAYTITDKCTGCTICDTKCPTTAIYGLKKLQYVIQPELCIDCNTCAMWCPQDAIQDDRGEIVIHTKVKDIPKATVDEETCTGCEYCIDACPFDCISLIERETDGVSYGGMSGTVAIVDEKTCVGCRVCEDFCIKESIYMKNHDKVSDTLSQYPTKQSYVRPEQRVVAEATSWS